MADWTTNAQISTLKRLLDATQSMDHMLYKATALTYDDLITVLHYDDTKNVTNMSLTFWGCTALTSIPALNTTNVTNMSEMVSGCTNLTNFPLLNTSNVTSMTRMFNNCTSLTVIPALDVSNVTVLGNTFQLCSNLQEIHIINIKVNLNISASTLFTREALVEIIGNLVDVGASRTLTMGATNSAKLTADDIAVATAKGWTIA